MSKIDKIQEKLGQIGMFLIAIIWIILGAATVLFLLGMGGLFLIHLTTVASVCFQL